jgi:translation initiation factor RLI1
MQKRNFAMIHTIEHIPGRLDHPARYYQKTDYSGLSDGKLSPTDIDGLFEYHNVAYIFFEIKYLDKEMPTGQRLALQRLAVDLARAGKDVVILVIEHDVADTNETVNVGLFPVREILFGNQCLWRAPKRRLSAREAKVAFLEYVDSKKAAA